MDIFSLLAVLKAIMRVIVIGGSVFLFFAACSIYTNLTTGVPWAKVPRANVYRIFKELGLPADSLVYDLGAGDGRVLFAAESFGWRAVGFELSLYPYVKACLKKIFCRSRIVIKRQDFFKENLSQADAVFIFLAGKTIARVGEKLKLELKKGALIISYGFALPGRQIEKIISTKPSLTYVYKT